MVEAVDAGRKVAVAVDRYLGGDGDISEVLIEYERPDDYLGRIEGYAKMERGNCVDLDNAEFEAERCLRCHMRLEIEKPKVWNEYKDIEV